jgi:two-component system, OmpR family, phosphate regulon response regulator PhoB
MRGRTILVAEDDRFLRRAAELALKQRGFAVVLAEDGAQALELARTCQPDLVLLDVLMPRMTGIEVLRQLRADDATRKLPVLVLSNSSKELDVDTANQLGIEGYWIKANLSLKELGDRVTALVSRETHAADA